MKTEHQRRKRWTDDDYRILEEMWDQPLGEVAKALNVSLDAVYNRRSRARKGHIFQSVLWTAEEDSVILDCGLIATDADLALKLPGRTKRAVRSRRQRLGVEARMPQHTQASPFQPGGRPVLAKTCRRCGLLLPAGWFLQAQGRFRNSHCRKCEGVASKQKRDANPSLAAQASKRSAGHAQRMTKLYATRLGQPYIEADYKVLNNPDLTALQKALRIGRTYSGTKNALARAGIKASNTLGDPERDKWIIDNPNIANLEAIQASLVTSGDANPPARPAFDWND